MASFIRRSSLQVGGQNVPNLPTGALKGAEVDFLLTGHSGVPATALLLAYEPVQRLLAVGTRDGRIKLFGADGSEDLLIGAGKEPCKYLEFINNHNALVHVSMGNEIKVFDVNEREVAASLQWKDCITALSVNQGTTFLYVGDETGTVSVVQYSAEEGILSTTPYSVPGHLALPGLVEPGSMEGGIVVAVLPQPGALHNRILIVYSIGLMVLWGLYQEHPLIVRGGSKSQHAKMTGVLAGKLSVQSMSDDEDDPQEISNACWASASGKLLAVGYLNGDIGLWNIPNPFSSKKVEGDPWAPLQLVKLIPSDQRMPISSLHYAGGGRDAGRIYVLGGGDCQHPLKITVLAVAEEDATKLPAQAELPWFGLVGDFKLLRDTDDVCGPATAIAVLDSSGQLRTYYESVIAEAIVTGKDHPLDVQPVPLHLPLSELSITIAKAFVSAEDQSAIGSLLKMFGDDRPAPSSQVMTFGWTHRRHSGNHIGSLPAVYVSGHKNGTVQIWDASLPGFHLICTVPESLDKEEVAGEVYLPISSLDFCSASGILVIAHDGGLVRVYSLFTEKGEFCKRIIKRDGTVEKGSTAVTGAGFQAILDVLVHQATVIHTSVASAAGLVALADTSGVVSLVDLKAPVLLYSSKPISIPLALNLSLVPSALSGIPALSPRGSIAASPRGSSSPSAVKQDIAAFVTNAKAAVFVVSEKLRYEFQLTEAKSSASKAEPSVIHCFLLDVSGLHISSPANQLGLAWISEVVSGKTEGTPDKSMDIEQTDIPLSTLTDSVESVPAVELVSAPKKGNEESMGESSDEKGGSPSASFSSGHLEPVFLLLCTDKHLMMYNITAMPAGRFNFLTKTDLPGICVRVFPLGLKDVMPPGLLLLYESGDIEIRSLPDLTVVAKTSITESAGWELQMSSLNLKTFTCTRDGHLSMVVSADADGSAEVVRMSLLTSSSSQLPRTSPEPQDSEGTAVPLVTVGGGTTQKKLKGFKSFKSRLRGMAKEAKSVVATVQSNLPSEVTKALKKGTKVVASIGNSVSSNLPTKGLSLPRKSKLWLGSISEKPVMRSPSDLQVLFMKPLGASEELDIDDIDIDDIGVANVRSPALEDKRASQDLKKKASSSGERSSEDDPLDKASRRESAERAKLFAGGSASNSSSSTPHVRTAAEIRAKYGHPSASDVGGAAREARNKLAERGERLQAVQDKTQELEDGAANFASLAQELAKKMEGKKWWEL